MNAVTLMRRRKGGLAGSKILCLYQPTGGLADLALLHIAVPRSAMCHQLIRAGAVKSSQSIQCCTLGAFWSSTSSANFFGALLELKGLQSCKHTINVELGQLSLIATTTLPVTYELISSVIKIARCCQSFSLAAGVGVMPMPA